MIKRINDAHWNRKRRPMRFEKNVRRTKIVAVEGGEVVECKWQVLEINGPTVAKEGIKTQRRHIKIMSRYEIAAECDEVHETLFKSSSCPLLLCFVGVESRMMRKERGGVTEALQER